jgi:tRNA (Thr-GGU) A37 N-methylase
MPICNRCKKERDLIHLEKIDNEIVCHSCLYGNHKPYKIYPIGIVKNQLARGHKFGLTESRNEISKIELFKSQEPFLYRLKDEKWILVVYFFHKQRQIRSTFSRGLDGKKVGIFASRTPERLSRIGITNVELIKIEDTTLFIKNLDAIDGSPVLDVKLGSKSIW